MDSRAIVLDVDHHLVGARANPDIDARGLGRMLRRVGEQIEYDSAQAPAVSTNRMTLTSRIDGDDRHGGERPGDLDGRRYGLPEIDLRQVRLQAPARALREIEEILNRIDRL